MAVIPTRKCISTVEGRNVTPDPKLRKADVFLKGHLVLTLR
jgi:hypothetical protein